LAPKLMEEAVTTESKVFSIFATGFVQAGKRQTRTRIHAVIDMRGAPPPGTAENQARFAQMQNAQMAGMPGGGQADDDTGGIGDLPDGFETGGFARALLPRPGGSILYYRVD